MRDTEKNNGLWYVGGFIAVLIAVGFIFYNSDSKFNEIAPASGTTQIDQTTNYNRPTETKGDTVNRNVTTFPTPSNMNSQQFNNFVTSRWDSNGDGVITRSEWTTSGPSWFSSNNTTVGTFDTWDSNNNGELDSTELGLGFSNSRLYQAYDTNGDGVIDSTEAGRIPR
jgi:hypothetical protein